MKNHFHLLVKPKTDESLTLFMRKLGTGYANYFNQKYKRGGTLFQGKYKTAHINNESHFIHLPYYIHCNPLDYFAQNWKKREIKDCKAALSYLENYRWSSFKDYIGVQNFPSVTQRDYLLKFFDGPKEYKTKTKQWLKSMDWEEMKKISLE